MHVSLNVGMSHSVIILPTRAITYLTNILPVSCWSGVQKTPQTIQDTVIAFGCLPWLEGKTLLLKSRYSSDTLLGELLLKVTWKPSAWRLVLIVLESAVQAATGEKQSVALPSCKKMTIVMTDEPRYPLWCNSGIFVLGVTNTWLIGLTVCSIGENSCLVLLT